MLICKKGKKTNQKKTGSTEPSVTERRRIMLSTFLKSRLQVVWEFFFKSSGRHYKATNDKPWLLMSAVGRRSHSTPGGLISVNKDGRPQ